MPRKKANVPQRLNEEQREEHNWNLGESSGSGSHQQDNEPHVPLIDLIEDEIEDYDSEEDIDFIPNEERIQSKVKNNRKTKKPSTEISTVPTDENLETLFDSSDFRVCVTTVLPEDEWKSHIWEFEFNLQNLSAGFNNFPAEYSIYLSSVPGLNFVFFNKEKYYKVEDIPSNVQDLLKAFEHGTIGTKRRNVMLTHGNIEETKLTIKVTVMESTLSKLNHPSDVMAKVPTVVRKSMEHFLQLDHTEDDFDDDDANEFEMFKQDIDHLYNIIKDYHSKNDVPDSIDPQHKSLLPKLRPYQKNAVKWMVHREKSLQQFQDDEKLTKFQNNELHTLYTQVITKDGTKMYYNRKGGFLVKEFPHARPMPTGGILADEMGLGKTVEVLSCMLCNPKLDLPKPEPLEVINIYQESRKRRRRRSPSPTEFQLYEHENEDLCEEVGELRNNRKVSFAVPEIAMEISDEAKTMDDESSEDQKINIAQIDGGDTSDEDFEASTSSTSSEEEAYVPVPSRRRRMKGNYEDYSDSEDSPLSIATKKVFSRKKSNQINKMVKSKESSTTSRKKTKNTIPASKFDPASILGNKNINEKSKLEDMILYAIIKKSTSNSKTSSGVSVGVIKKYLVDMKFKTQNAKTNKLINNEILKLQNFGKILNTSGLKGASGSFVINPEFENFDSRSLYFDNKISAASSNNFDSIDEFLETLITERCYDGEEYVKIKTETELKLEKAKKDRQAKKESLYDKLKPMYELELGLSYNASEYAKQSSSYYNGKFFDTKVEQQDYFECICGSDLDPDEDRKYRVQCKDCNLYQHAECVRYDVSDPLRGEYHCPHCWTLQEPVESGATLIVSPSSISYQWIEEIQKHIKHKNVRMLFYKGTKTAGYIQPQTLANYDIVVTTYQVLQSETNYVDLPHSNSAEGRRFRNPKRFMAIPAPLPCVKWWRMVMDEAQMIESTTTKTAEMALRLEANHRWCVTGTPIGKSLNELFGLLMFLKIDPYCLEFWWKRCLFDPYIRGNTKYLEDVLCQIMWRTVKKDVLDQINIPKQAEEIHWLSFSPVEEHFYRRQHIDSSKEAVNRIKKYSNQDMKLSEMDRQSLNNLLGPLLRLRQSCCHPQAVKGQFMSLQKSTMTMEELMEQMVKKTTLECEDSNRQYVSSLNGLAGLDIIEENFENAVEKYREVLRVVDEYKGKIKTDTLQKLHSVSNLAELLEAGHENIPPTLRDDKLRDEAKELQKKYLNKYSTAVLASKEAVDPITTQVENFRESFTCQNEAWYVKAMNSVKSTAQEEAFLKLVLEEMAQFYDVVNDREFKQIEQKYSSSRMVLYKVSEKIEELDGMRNQVCKDLVRLEKSPPEAFLNKAVDCHLRMSSMVQKEKEKCVLCTVHENIEIYEGILFHFVKDEKLLMQGKHIRSALNEAENKKLEDAGVVMMDELRRGHWQDSESERLLRAILKYSKNYLSEKSHKNIIEDGIIHMKMFESLKKEFKLCRILWRQHYDHVAAVDELNMSVMRLRLRFEDEPLVSQNKLKIKKDNSNNGADKKTNTDLSTRTKAETRLETIYILEKHEIPAQRLKLVSEKTVANTEFKKKFGQLLYLNNLKNSDYSKKGGGENPEPCPICQKALGMQWSVLQCGHCFCIECIRILIQEYSSGRSLKCAICRNLTHQAEISYVNTKVDHNSEEDLEAYESVKGSLSTKMEAVVKTLIKIQNDDPTAKCLVFSTWNDVLDILGTALIQNDIQFAALHAQGKFKRNLQKFKNREDVKVLLLPISSGANGLNLIEASHVLLMEPILNPAQELQAIGRVHRIGQNKPTTVHRFLIRSTIEERMQKMLKSHMLEEKEQTSHLTEENILTIKDLASLFVDG